MNELTMCMAGAILLLVAVHVYTIRQLSELERRLDKIDMIKHAMLEAIEAEHREFLKSIHEPGREGEK